MKRKAIYLDINADLAVALNKLQQNDADEMILVIPRGSVLFNSVVNLKILQSNIPPEKSLAIVTMDKTGQSLANQVGLKVYKNITAKDGDINDSDNIMAQSVDIKTDVEPEIEPDAEPELKPELDNRSKIDLINSQTSKPKIKFESNRKLPTSNLSNVRSKSDSPFLTKSIILGRNGLLIVFITLAFMVLGGVIYFVLPKATIDLDIKSEPFIHQFKLVLANKEDLNAAGQNVFKGRFVEVTKELIKTFPATGFENKGNPASGFITIYNYTRTIKGLIPETRFVSPDELVFRIKEEVLISPATVGSNGSLIPGRSRIKVVADTGGVDGNLPIDVKFTIPGLGSTGVDLVFAKSTDPFTGGTDNKVKIVLQEDIELARESISKNVFLDTELELTELVKKSEELIVPLIQNDIIDSIPSVAAGAKREAFDLKIQVRSWTLLPDKNQLEDIISNTINNIIPSNKSLTPQTLKSARVVMDNADFLMYIIDFSVEINGLIASKLDKSEISGSVSNRLPSDATKMLESIQEIVSHKIVVWPFWVKRLPILENNIKINFSYIN